jgi:hypothetical protein
MRRRSFAIALIAAISLKNMAGARAAFAGDDDSAMALNLFDRGRELFREERYVDALTEFEAAAKLMRTFGILLNIAECQEKLGRTASAWATWNEARAVASLAKHAEDERTAVERQTALEGRLSRLTILVPSDAEAPDLEVRRDGTKVPREAWGTAFPVDPGSHVVEARAPGRKPETVTVAVLDHADHPSVTLTALKPVDPPPPAPIALTEPAPPPPQAASPAPFAAPEHAAPQPTSPQASASSLPPSAATVSDAPSQGGGQRLAGWFLASLGVACAGGGIGIALIGQHQHDDAVATDLAGNLPQAQNMESESATTKTLGYVTIGGGAALLATGLILVLTAPAGSRSGWASTHAFATLQVTPWASTAGGGALLSRAW